MRDVCEATGKLQYPSAQAADKALRLPKRGRWAYKCDACHWWHTSSKSAAGGNR